MNIEEVRADIPVTLSMRNMMQLFVKHSFFEKIVWPGFYIFNISSVNIKDNAFLDVAPRSIVAKKGKLKKQFIWYQAIILVTNHANYIE